ncbi:hypothetical protein ACFVH4_18825 [Nocardia ignorata]|uniref:hypothetical protein n=1 Tax=Nocardia ignorata TaxID=145285 RepID=UPI00362FF94D
MIAVLSYGLLLVACWCAAGVITVAAISLAARCLRRGAPTSSLLALRPGDEDGPAAGDAAGPTSFHQ